MDTELHTEANVEKINADTEQIKTNTEKIKESIEHIFQVTLLPLHGADCDSEVQS